MMNTQHPWLRRLIRPLTLLMLLALLLGSAGTSAAPNRLPAVPGDYNVTTPRDFFGYDIGQDYKITPWETRDLPGEGTRKGIIDYAHELERTSPRVRTFQYGTTGYGRPMVMSVFTSPDNWAQIDNLKGILKKLADPRQVASDAEAKMLAQQGKAVYWISPAQHATERSSPEVMLKLGYELASSNDAWTKQLLDNVIVVIEGSLNPDGLDMVTDWYYQYKGTPYAGTGPTYYNRYVNHDNNRDFVGVELEENRANVQARYEWNPTVYHDLHQSQDMLFLYPTPDPTNYAVNPVTVAEWIGFGGHTQLGLISKGWKGAFVYDYSDNWYPGYNDAYSSIHNTNGHIYELQSVQAFAEPRTITSPGRHTVRTWYNPAPYTASVSSPLIWRLADAVNFEEDALKFELDYLMQNKTDLLYNFYVKGKTNMAKSAGTAPYGFIIPQNAGDNADVTDMINNLHVLQHIDVDRLGASMTYNGVTYQPGDYVVRADQPYGLIAKDLMNTPPYDSTAQPFDVVGWDYRYLRDVQAISMTTKLPAGTSLIPVTGTVPYLGSLTGDVSPRYIIEHQSNNNLAKALPQLWANPNFQVSQADAAFTAGAQNYPAGTFVVETTGSQADHDTMAGLATQLGLTIHATSAVIAGTVQLHQPRVALYTPDNGTGNTLPEGWVRLRLDRAKFPYDRLYGPKGDVNATKLANYDVVIFPDLSPSGIITGSTSSSLPPEFRGGIGMAGVAALKAWVQDGGTLVMLNKAGRFPMDAAVKWDTGVALAPNSLAMMTMLEQSGEDLSQDPPERNPYKAALTAAGPKAAMAATVAPGSIVRLQVNPNTKVGYGYDVEEASWLDTGTTPWFVTTRPGPAVVANYPANGPILLNGYLQNEANILGKPAIVDAPFGAGRVVFLGPNTTYRGQATGTFMLFFNALIEGGRTAATAQ
jgi:hypothetical protein